uniref:Uncharacterized protein n=1 Tax=Tanacetum cinerariifolium TaxID=118510 RepID=A0A699I2S9_TANCI|nr:hypothetical protein [Tanacetum cinerariifolium]
MGTARRSRRFRRFRLPKRNRHVITNIWACIPSTPSKSLEHQRNDEMVKVKKRLGTLEANYSLVLSNRDEWRRAFLNLQALVFERLGLGAWDARLDVIGNKMHKAFPLPVDPPKGTLVPRVQLATADEVDAKRCGYLVLN